MGLNFSWKLARFSVREVVLPTAHFANCSSWENRVLGKAHWRFLCVPWPSGNGRHSVITVLRRGHLAQRGCPSDISSACKGEFDGGWFRKIKDYFRGRISGVGLLGVSVEFKPSEADLSELNNDVASALHNILKGSEGTKQGFLLL